MNIFKILAMSSVLALSACQDIKDTYADFTGDGEIRYIGKCDNLSVSPGWKRLIVDWTNNVDPVIDKIKLKWSTDEMADSVFLERGTSEYSINNLTDGTYQISICSLDKEGRESLLNTIYGRPYSSNHEEVLSFTKIISKNFFLGNKAIFLFSGWQDGIESAYLKYTKKDGSEGNYTLNKSIVSNPIYVLPEEVDSSKPMFLYRKGYIGTCSDLISFDPVELTHDVTYSSDFKDFLRNKYGTTGTVVNEDGNINSNWANNVESLDIDADLNSFEDLLAMPKLKKLSLGKNTYLTTEGAKDATRGQYKLYESKVSNTVLELLHEQTGLVVERYANHYQGLEKKPYIKDMGLVAMPKLELIDLSKGTITQSPEDMEGYSSRPENLFDGKSSTCWNPLPTTSQKNYIITIDLGQEVEASGVKIVQKDFLDTQENAIAPQKIVLQYADKSGGYQDVSYVTDNYIGTSTGQVTLIPFAGGKKKVRYLRFSVLSQNYYGSFDVTLAEVGLYK